MTDQAQIDHITRAMTRLIGRAKAFSNYCFRCVKPKYSSRHNAFSGEGSQKSSGRYHVKGEFVLVYTSTDLQTAEWEYLNTARSIGIDTAYLLPFSAIGAEVTLAKVLNLNDRAVRRTLGVTLTQLRTSSWQGSSTETLTQVIGRLAYEAGFEAILAPSVGKGHNLNIFRQNLLAGSSVKIINEDELPGH